MYYVYVEQQEIEEKTKKTVASKGKRTLNVCTFFHKLYYIHPKYPVCCVYEDVMMFNIVNMYVVYSKSGCIGDTSVCIFVI